MMTVFVDTFICGNGVSFKFTHNHTKYLFFAHLCRQFLTSQSKFYYEKRKKKLREGEVDCVGGWVDIGCVGSYVIYYQLIDICKAMQLKMVRTVGGLVENTAQIQFQSLSMAVAGLASIRFSSFKCTYCFSEQ